jgi:thiol-disulfide isomerase/thioredoxin
MTRSSCALVFAALSSVLGCKTEVPSAEPKSQAAPSAEHLASASSSVTILKAPAGSVAPSVREILEKSPDRTVLVYAGAPWCEPCQRFHKAAASGELDAMFPKLTLVEYNVDDDRDRLTVAGYTSALIPLFVVPNKDGTASPARIEGGIKGDGAVAFLAGRLKDLLKPVKSLQ